MNQHQEPPDKTTRQRTLTVEPSTPERHGHINDAARTAGVGNDGPHKFNGH